MKNLSRRNFLKYSAQLVAMMGLEASAIPQIAQALSDIASGNPPVIWLQGLSCSGCSVSLLNSTSPSPAEILTGYINLKFHSTLSTMTGSSCLQIIEKTVERGNFFLVVEGALPAGMPAACTMEHKPMIDIVREAGAKANAVLAVGSCAAAGGVPAADNNPTQAVSVPMCLENAKITTPTISLPGCPCHPDWLVGTLAHVLRVGVPALDKAGRPVMFYGKCIHDQCPRFADYEREQFAKMFGDDGCLFKLGCLGPITRADCTLRYWNNGANTCIRAGAPCIGCASRTFARSAAVPFYRLNPAFGVAEFKKPGEED